MPKYKLTMLSPVHISSGNTFELNYNLLEKEDFVYFYDEFRLVEFFIAHNLIIPSSLDGLKRLMNGNKDKIIDSGLHIRKIESDFSHISKTLLENITTANHPIITGSSLKGSFRTAILDAMVNNPKDSQNFREKCKDKNFDQARFNKNIDNDLASIFKYLKVTDSLSPLETKVYKTVNIKKNRNHQGGREIKVENIANYVEAIKPNQVFEIEITDTNENRIFQDLGTLCNLFYIPFLRDDDKQYFSKSGYLREIAKELSSTKFLINVGRFSGAERKSLNNLRDIKASKAEDKSQTSARTFALENYSNDKIYFENKLLPFGWVLCEAMEDDKDLKQLVKTAKEKSEKNKIESFEAIDRLHNLKMDKERDENLKQEIKQKEKKAQEKLKEDKKAKREAELEAMSPLEREIDELIQNDKNNTPQNTLILKALEDGVLKTRPNEVLDFLKSLMVNEKKWIEVSKAKNPKKDKDHQKTIKVLKMINNLDKN